MKTARLSGFLLLLGAVSAWAGLLNQVDTDPSAHIKISLYCCFNPIPPSGYAPIDVTIDNLSKDAHEWLFSSASPGGYPSSASNTFSTTLKVAASTSRSFHLLVPLAPSLGPGAMAAGFTARIAGFGCSADRDFRFGGSFSGRLPTPFAALSEGVIGVSWSALDRQLTSYSSQLCGSPFVPGELPDDWRGLSGVTGLWITAPELATLSSAQRAALRTWVRLGGTLEIWDDPTIPADFAPPAFGQVRAFRAHRDIPALAAVIHSLPRPTSSQVIPAEDPQLRAALPHVMPVIAFMTLFALVVGPLNVFVLAGSRRRHRLFWTTPLISLAGSLLLVLDILWQDGVGGHGGRQARVYILPAEHTAIVHQEQTSHTGLLLGSAFQVRDPVVMREVLPERSGPVMGRALRNDGTSFAGEWFSSRSVQRQVIQAALPTRSELTLTNAAAVRDQAQAPILLSSFPTPLTTLWYVDENRMAWQGHDIRTGQRQTLQPGRPASPGGQSSPLPSPPPGCFSATAADASCLVDTLPSIRWQDDPVIYQGPVTSAP